MGGLSHVVTLVTQRNPLDPGSRVVQYLSPEEGATVGDVLPPWVRVVPEGGVRISLNGGPARLDQLLVHGDIVEVLEVPLGLLVPFVATAATSAASALAAKAATAAFFLGAAKLGGLFALNFVVGKLLAPNRGPSGPGDETSPTYRFGGITSNQDAEGAALPLVYGQIRTGGVVVQRYTRSSLLSTYLYTLIVLSEGPVEAIGDVTTDAGPLRLSDGNLPKGMEINGRPASDYEDIEVHVRLGGLYQDPVPGFEASSVQYAVDQALPESSTPGTIEITPKTGGYDPGVGADATELAKWDTEVTYSMGADEEADEFSATILFPEGLYSVSGSGGLNPNTARFQIRYQELDGTGTPIGKVVVLPAEGTVSLAKQSPFDIEFRHPFIDPATYVAPAKGYYLKLQGVNGCVTRASPTGMTDPQVEKVQWTSAGWVKIDVDDQNASQTYQVWNFWDGATNRGMRCRLEYVSAGAAKRLELWVVIGTGSGTLSYSVNVETITGPFFAVQSWVTGEVEQWHHISVTYDGSGGGVAGAGRLKMYWDGALVRTVNLSNVPHRLPTAGTVRVGAETNTTNFADADFDVFKFFLRALSGSEIQVQYANGAGFTGTGSEPDLLLCWAFDTSGGGTTPDLSPNGNAGTLVTGAAISVGTDFGVAPGSAGGTFKRGRYRVEIQRLDAESTSTLARNGAEWSAIQLVTWADFTYPGAALVGIRQKATDQLQGGAPSYTFEMKGRRVPVWDGASTVTPSAPLKWSQNPAWIAAAVLTGEEGLGDRYGLKDLRLDEFKAWADWCDEFVPDGLEEVSAAGLTTKQLTYDGTLQRVTATLSAVASVPDKWAAGYHVRLESLTGTGASQYQNAAGEAYEIVSVAYVSATSTLTLVLAKPETLAAPTTSPVTLTAGKVRGAERRMQCDIVLDRRNDEAPDVLDRIFATGRAPRIVQGGRVGVFVDRPASPVALVTHASVERGSLQTLYTAIDERPNVIQAEILDRDAGYTVQRLELEHPDVQDPASFNGRRVRSIGLEGVVRRSQALREIKYQLNLYYLIRRQASWKQPLLAIARRPGDVVMVAHDVPQWGYSGKLRGSSATQAVALTATAQNPSWINVGFIQDYTVHAGIFRRNLLSGARPWISETASGPKNLTDNGAPKFLDANAIPTALGVNQRLATVLFRDLLTSGIDAGPLPPYKSGVYVIEYDGGACTPEVAFDASGLTQVAPRKWEFTVATPSSSGIHFALVSVSSAPEGLRIYRKADADAIATDPWDPDFVAFMAPFAGLRWMEAQDTNNDDSFTPKPPGYLFWTESGPPIEWMCDFSNRYGKDLWVCCPVRFGPVAQFEFASRVRSALSPTRRVRMEWGNEGWNGGAFEFPAASGTWYLGSRVSSWYPFFVGNNFLPHPTISGAYIIGPGAIDPNPFTALYKQIGISSNDFFTQVEAAWAGDLGRVDRVFGAQYANTGSVSIGVPLCPKCTHVAGAPYNPPSPTDPDFDPSVKSVNELFTNMAAKHTEISGYITAFVAAVAAEGKSVLWYEGGQQLIAPSGGVATLMAAQQDPRMKDEMLWLFLEQKTAAPSAPICFYSDATAGGPEGQFGAKRWHAQPANLAPKFQALLEWIGDTGAGGGGAPSGEADYTLFLDRDVQIGAGTHYVVIQDLSTNEHATFTVQSTAGTYLAGEGLVVRGTDQWVPAKGDQYSLGTLGKVYKLFRVLSTKIDGERPSVEVEAVEYNESTYSDDFGTLPLPETNLKANTIADVTPEAVQSLAVAESTAQSEDGTTVLSAALSWQLDPETAEAVDRIELYIQPRGGTPQLRQTIQGPATEAQVKLDQIGKDQLLEFIVRPIGRGGAARPVRASAKGFLRPLGLVVTPAAPTSLAFLQAGYRGSYNLVASGPATAVAGYEFRRGGWILGQRIGFTGSGETQLGPVHDISPFTDDAGANGPYKVYARPFLGSGQYGKQVELSAYGVAPGRVLFERHLQDYGATGWDGVTLTGFTRAVSSPGTALVADSITTSVSIDYTMPALREAQDVFVYICWEADQTYTGAETPTDTPLGNRWTTEGPLWTYPGETTNATTRLGWKYGTTTAGPALPGSSDGFRPGPFYLRRGRLLLRFTRSSPSLVGITLKRAYIAVVEAPAPRLNFPNVEAFL